MTRWRSRCDRCRRTATDPTARSPPRVRNRLSHGERRQRGPLLPRCREVAHRDPDPRRRRRSRSSRDRPRRDPRRHRPAVLVAALVGRRARRTRSLRSGLRRLVELLERADGRRRTSTIPELNHDHLDLLEVQRDERGWDGALVKNPNCSTITAVPTLAALDTFGLETAHVATLQAVSVAATRA